MIKREKNKDGIQTHNQKAPQGRPSFLKHTHTSKFGTSAEGRFLLIFNLSVLRQEGSYRRMNVRLLLIMDLLNSNLLSLNI